MTKQAIIERTVRAINQLPEDKAEEISNFADFISKRYEEGILTQGIQKLTTGRRKLPVLTQRRRPLFHL